jgi:hypothetical protein
VHDGEEFVQIIYPIARNRRHFSLVGEDDFEIDLRPTIALTPKPDYDGDTVNAIIAAQQAGYSLGSLFGRKLGHIPRFYSTRACLVAAPLLGAYCGACGER